MKVIFNNSKLEFQEFSWEGAKTQDANITAGSAGGSNTAFYMNTMDNSKAWIFRVDCVPGVISAFQILTNNGKTILASGTTFLPNKTYVINPDQLNAEFKAALLFGFYVYGSTAIGTGAIHAMLKQE